MPKQPKKKDDLLPMAIVWWDDSFGGGGWIDKDEYECRLAMCVTAGFVISEGDDHISITSSLTQGNDGQYLGPITIPKSCITKRKDLKA